MELRATTHCFVRFFRNKERAARLGVARIYVIDKTLLLRM